MEPAVVSVTLSGFRGRIFTRVFLISRSLKVDEKKTDTSVAVSFHGGIMRRVGHGTGHGRAFSSSYVRTWPRNNDGQLSQLEHRVYRTDQQCSSCSSASNFRPVAINRVTTPRESCESWKSFNKKEECIRSFLTLRKKSLLTWLNFSTWIHLIYVFELNI